MRANHSPAPRGGSVFQFSIRTFLWLFTLAIVFAWIGRQALRGSEILVALAGVLLLFFGFFAICIVLFLIGWLPAFVSYRMGVPFEEDDPYGRDAEPPQIKSLLLILAAVLCLPARAGAQPGNGFLGRQVLQQLPDSEVRWNVQLPLDPKHNSGFRLDIRGENTLVVGYHPVRLTVRPTIPFAADRTLEVLFQPRGAGAAAQQVEGRVRSLIRCELHLQQGQTSATKDVYLPHYTYDPGYRIRIAEGGVPLEGYECTVGSSRWPLSLVTVPNRIGVLLPDEVRTRQPRAPWQRTPDPTQLFSALQLGGYPGQQGWGQGLQSSLAPELDEHHQALLSAYPLIACVLGEQQLWDNWLGYESLDILLLPFPMLQRLSTTDPDKVAAIRHFAAAGGTLWLYAAPDEDTVQQIFQTTTPGTPQRPVGRPRMALPEDIWIQDYVLGQLVCFQSEYPFPGKRHEWNTILNGNPMASTVALRRGVDPTLGDSRFWLWVLPGVARPPVYPFLALLGLFAFGVGPVAYRISSKLKRIYLMLIAAPVLALLTTLLMLGYGLLSDGLGYKARVREVTWVDSHSGTGLRWARATYFAGIRPPDGLHFDAHTAVYPYPQDRQSEMQVSGQEAVRGEIVLREDGQNFLHGFLPSRQQSQFITFTPQERLGGLASVGGNADAPSDAPPADSRMIRNRFEFPLRSLLLRDRNGSYWYAEAVDAQQTVEVVRYADLTAASMLRQLYSDNVLERPAGFPLRNRSGRTRNEYDLIRDAGLRLPAQYRGMTEGIVEQRLRELLQVDGQLPRGHFLALADVTPDVVARAGSQLSDSVHFCLGTWQ